MADDIRDEVRAVLLDPEFLKAFAEAFSEAFLDTPWPSVCSQPAEAERAAVADADD